MPKVVQEWCYIRRRRFLLRAHILQKKCGDGDTAENYENRSIESMLPGLRLLYGCACTCSSSKLPVVAMYQVPNNQRGCVHSCSSTACSISHPGTQQQCSNILVQDRSQRLPVSFTLRVVAVATVQLLLYS